VERKKVQRRKEHKESKDPKVTRVRSGEDIIRTKGNITKVKSAV
jgi:hypothetical protein